MEKTTNEADEVKGSLGAMTGSDLAVSWVLASVEHADTSPEFCS